MSGAGLLQRKVLNIQENSIKIRLINGIKNNIKKCYSHLGGIDHGGSKGYNGKE